jgi:serine phosphatase RsbU (regulator of sigma subunit)
MRLVVLAKGTKIAELACDDEAIYIGSREGCAVRLDDPRVAPQHAVIFADDHEGWVLEPLEQDESIQLNGVAIPQRVALRNADEIAIHDHTVRAYFEEPKLTPTPATTTSVAALTQFVRFQLPAGSSVRKPDEELTLRAGQMARLARANMSLSHCSAVESLMDVALQRLFELIPAQRAWVGVRRVNYGAMEYVQGQTMTGQTTELPEIGERLKPRVLDRGQYVLIPYARADAPFSALAGPLCGPDGTTLGMVYLDTGDSGRRFEAPDLDLFVAINTLLAAQLDAIFREGARVRAAMLEGEVAVVHAVQARLTPRKLPQWPELQFGAFREPGRSRCGDIYDIVRLNNGMAAFMIAHTSAVGPAPAMLIAQAQAGFRTSAMHLDRPHIYLRTMNALMYDGAQDHPLELFTGVIHPPTGRMKFALAGNLGAYIISARGEERRLEAPARTPPLGVDKNAAYDELTEELAAGETLVLFTPGVITARNGKEVTFGEERLVNILCDGFGQLASSMLKDMLTDLRNFTEAGAQPDDITVILAHRV